MESIICPTDFSENAKKATNWAAFLSSKFGIPLHLYHCYHIPVIVNEIPFPIGSEMEIETGLNQLMNEESDRLKGIYKDIVIKTKVEAGFANQAILNYAQEQKSKLIVIGITGRSATGQILIGSTSIALALNSKIPVLIIPSQAKSLKITNISLACDFKERTKLKDSDLLFNLIDGFNSNVSLVHVTTKNESTDTKLNLGNTIQGIEKYKFSVHTIEDESVEPGLVHFTEKNNIDLLTVIHKQHGFFERIFTRSHTSKLAYKINIPLLVLNE